MSALTISGVEKAYGKAKVIHGVSVDIASGAGYGISPADIACVLDIPEEELRAIYGRELDSSPIKANAKGGREPLPQSNR